MSRTKLFLNNSAAMALQQLVMVAVGFIVPRLIIVTYGSQINGLVVSLTQFIAYFILVEAGISGAAIYALYKPLAAKDTHAINGILAAGRRFYIQSGLIFAGLVLLLSSMYPFIVQNTGLAKWQVALIVFAIGANGAADFFALAKYRILLTADQKSYIISCATIASSLLNITMVVFLTAVHVNIVLLQVTLVLCVILRTAIVWAYAQKHYKYLDFNVKPNATAIKDRWNVLYLQLLGGMQISVPVIIATVFLPLKEVSVYSIYNMVVGGINSVLGVFVSGLAASFGDVIARGQKDILQNAHQQFEAFYYTFITIVYCCSLLLLVPFVKLYTTGVTDANYILPVLGFMFVLNGLLFNLKTPHGMLVISAGMYRQTRWQSTLQGAIIIVIAGALAPFWGLYGILAGLLCSNIYRDIDLLFFVPKHITGLHYKHSLKRMLGALAHFALATALFYYIPINCNTFYQWVLYGFAIFAACCIWVTAINYWMDRAVFTAMYARIKNLINKRVGNA